MTIFILCVLAWLLIGLGAVAILLYCTYHDGDDFKLKDVGVGLLGILLGPITLAITVCQYFDDHRDMVLIKGKKKDV